MISTKILILKEVNDCCLEVWAAVLRRKEVGCGPDEGKINWHLLLVYVLVATGESLKCFGKDKGGSRSTFYLGVPFGHCNIIGLHGPSQMRYSVNVFCNK